MSDQAQKFSANYAKDAVYQTGLRDFMEYRDLGISDATHGQVHAHLIRVKPDREGELHHTRHRQWAFSYVPGEADDEPFYKLDSHLFVVGEYVTVTEQDGEVLTFRVADVQ